MFCWLITALGVIFTGFELPRPIRRYDDEDPKKLKLKARLWFSAWLITHLAFGILFAGDIEGLMDLYGAMIGGILLGIVSIPLAIFGPFGYLVYIGLFILFVMWIWDKLTK